MMIFKIGLYKSLSEDMTEVIGTTWQGFEAYPLVAGLTLDNLLKIFCASKNNDSFFYEVVMGTK